MCSSYIVKFLKVFLLKILIEYTEVYIKAAEKLSNVLNMLWKCE